MDQLELSIVDREHLHQLEQAAQSVSQQRGGQYLFVIVNTATQRFGYQGDYDEARRLLLVHSQAFEVQQPRREEYEFITKRPAKRRAA